MISSDPKRATKSVQNFCGVLKSQLFVRPMGLIQAIADDVMACDKGVAAIITTVYKQDALPVVSEVYKDLTDLFALRRGAKEYSQNHKKRSTAQIAKLNAHGGVLALHESMLAMMLFTGSNVDYVQHVQILFAIGVQQAFDANQSTDSAVAKLGINLSPQFYDSVTLDHPQINHHLPICSHPAVQQSTAAVVDSCSQQQDLKGAAMLLHLSPFAPAWILKSFGKKGLEISVILETWAGILRLITKQMDL